MIKDIIILIALTGIGFKFFRPKKSDKAGGINGKGIHQ